jgi:hypothetical protein
MSQISTVKLLQGIENVFSNLEYPGDENLVYDNSDKYVDVAETKVNFCGKHWRELSIDTINYHRDDLPFFTPEAFCFYLPAFLIASVSFPIEVIDVLPDNLMLVLTPDRENHETDAKLTTIVNRLTPQQKMVILDFLEWFTNKYVPDEIKFLDPISERATKFWKEITRSL